MVIPEGKAAYKKKDGVLTVTDNMKSVIWTPQSGGPPAISLSISDVTNLQQTPDSSAKVMLKIFERASPGSDPISYLFHFNSTKDPRAEANAVKELLSQLIANSKGSDSSVPRPTAAASGATDGNGASSAAMAFASTVNSRTGPVRLFDDSEIKNSMALQESLLKSDTELRELFKDCLATKPESMTVPTFMAQFWSTRINLLRAHEIELNQKKGLYNVLAQVKPTLEQSTDPTQPSRLKLSITVEQVQMIFKQHPLVKRIYNENVPPLTEGQFWERFFLSTLSKKLRGERPVGNEKPDQVFDKYDEYEDITAFSSKILSQTVPHIIDLEGNEENQGGFRSGNRKDVEMRPKGRNDVPIIQTLNSLSEKLLVHVAPADNDPENPLGDDGDTINQLALRDLQGDIEVHKIILNIKEQSRFFSNHDDEVSAATDLYAKQVPAQVLKNFQGDLRNLQGDGVGGINLHAALGIDDDSDSDEESQKKAHVGSRASRKVAQKQILDSMLQRRAQLYGHNEDETTPMGLPADVAAKCNLTHATTMEFLHQFWSAFLSGEPERAAEVGYLVESLRRSKQRINAVATEAEKAREEIITKKKEEIRAIYERTRKKVRFNINSIRGGNQAVVRLMEPLVQSLDRAIASYEKALAAEGLQASTEV